MKNTYEDFDVINIKFLAHLNLARSFVTKDQGVISWPNNSLDGKTIFIETTVKKTKHGFPSTSESNGIWYYLPEDGSPVLKRYEFYEHYKHLTK